MNPEVIGVSEFLDILNETMSFAYPEVVVAGEVSSFKINQGKWVFFDVKDEAASLGCFMSVYQLKVPLEDGMQVRVIGTPKITKWGKFSFTVKRVELAGEGELKRAFELLKKKLSAEGLFSPERKRALPQYPARIGLVTSGQSAAYADFVKILSQRWGGLDVKLADVQVQGAVAPDQVVAAIESLNQQPVPLDVLVIIRGGGSLEDLQAFNSEAVARAIAASRVPTLVGVGHEVDTSLADLSADVRAATPTDAARLVVPDRSAIASDIRYRQNRLEANLNERLRGYRQQVTDALGQIERYVRRPQQQLDRLRVQLQRDLGRLSQIRVRKAADVLAKHHDLELGLQTAVTSQKRRLDYLARSLRSVDPKAQLARGYSIVRQSDKIVRTAAGVSSTEPFVIQFSKGELQARIDD